VYSIIGRSYYAIVCFVIKIHYHQRHSLAAGDFTSQCTKFKGAPSPSHPLARLQQQAVERKSSIYWVEKAWRSQSSLWNCRINISLSRASISIGINYRLLGDGRPQNLDWVSPITIHWIHGADQNACCFEVCLMRMRCSWQQQSCSQTAHKLLLWVCCGVL